MEHASCIVLADQLLTVMNVMSRINSKDIRLPAITQTSV